MSATWPAEATLVLSRSGRRGGKGAPIAGMAATATCLLFPAAVTGLTADEPIGWAARALALSPSCEFCAVASLTRPAEEILIFSDLGRRGFRGAVETEMTVAATCLPFRAAVTGLSADEPTGWATRTLALAPSCEFCAAATLTWPAEATLVFAGSGRGGGTGALEAEIAAATICRRFRVAVTGVAADGPTGRATRALAFSPRCEFCAAATLTWPAEAIVVFSGSSRRGGRGVLKAEMAAAATCRAFAAPVTGVPADGLACAETGGSNASPSGDPVEAR